MRTRGDANELFRLATDGNERAVTALIESHSRIVEEYAKEAFPEIEDDARREELASYCNVILCVLIHRFFEEDCGNTPSELSAFISSKLVRSANRYKHHLQADVIVGSTTELTEDEGMEPVAQDVFKTQLENAALVYAAIEKLTSLQKIVMTTWWIDEGFEPNSIHKVADILGLPYEETEIIVRLSLTILRKQPELGDLLPL